MVCPGANGGKHENRVNFGLGSAITESIVAEMGKGDVVVEYISPRFMKFRIQLQGKSNSVSFSVGYAPTLDNRTIEKHCVWGSLDKLERGVHSRDYIIFLKNANTRIGMIAIRWKDSKVLGTYRRATNRTTTASDY